MSSFLTTLHIPVRLKRFYAEFKDKPFTLLDVGCGYHSPSMTVKYFPKCSYYGVDRDGAGNDDRDFRVMERFYRIDLSHGDLSEIPDAYFDVALFSHVIEHLTNGLEVLQAISRKVKPGGYIYVETPSLRSFAVPRARRHYLHFCDDSTHVRFYDMAGILNVLLEEQFRILRAGTRRDPVRLAATPALLLRGALKGDLWSGGPWDALGTAQYAYAVKRNTAVPQVTARPEATARGH